MIHFNLWSTLDENSIDARIPFAYLKLISFFIVNYFFFFQPIIDILRYFFLFFSFEKNEHARRFLITRFVYEKNILIARTGLAFFDAFDVETIQFLFLQVIVARLIREKDRAKESEGTKVRSSTDRFKII